MITIKCTNCKQEMRLYSTKGAAEYLGPFFGWGDALSALKYHIHEAHTIKGELIGHTQLFTQKQLDEFRATKHPQGRPKNKKGEET